MSFLPRKEDNSLINQHNPDSVLLVSPFWLNFRIGSILPRSHTGDFCPNSSQAHRWNEWPSFVHHWHRRGSINMTACAPKVSKLHMKFLHCYWETLMRLWEISAALCGLNRDMRRTETAVGEQTQIFMSSSCTIFKYTDENDWNLSR